jgi:hypothetical protein
MTDRPNLQPAGEPHEGGDDRLIAPSIEAAAEPDRVTRAGRRRRCPNCGSRNVARISYGYPAPGLEESPGYLSGEFVLGGCCVGAEMPTRHCHRCGSEW